MEKKPETTSGLENASAIMENQMQKRKCKMAWKRGIYKRLLGLR